MTIFADRRDAGQQLAERLLRFAGREDVIVLGLPRGGVPVAFEVARTLDAPLDVFVVRKLGVPGHPELGMGAVAVGGIRVVNPQLLRRVGITSQELDAVTAGERRELERRVRAYRGDRAFPELRGKTVILVDDGIATGSTMTAAVHALREYRPRAIVVAAPVMSVEAEEGLARLADDCECVMSPVSFYGVGSFYRDFRQTTDEQVRGLLQMAMQHTHPAGNGASHAGHL